MIDKGITSLDFGLLKIQRAKRDKKANWSVSGEALPFRRSGI